MYVLTEDRADSIRAFVAHALTEIDGRNVIGVVYVPAPFAPLSTFLRAAPRPMSVLWDEPSGVPMATAGVVEQVTLKGADRYNQLRRWTGNLWPRLTTFVHEDCVPGPVRLFGGFAFHPDEEDSPWREFGDGSFTLPRWYYGQRGDDAFLGLTVHGEADRGLQRHGALMEELDRLTDWLQAYERQATGVKERLGNRVSKATVEQAPFEEWRAHLAEIQRALESGRYHKIVAMRRCDVVMPGPVDDLEVFSALAAEPACTRFAFRRDTTSFVGASPETLFRKAGPKLATQALAGTIRSLGSEFPVLSKRSNDLLESAKDNAEHDLVVRDIEEALWPFCEEVTSSRHPQVRKVRNILHLNTPFEARLRADVDPVDLVMALHPTPAVGGMPKREAAEWIARNEPGCRGWYTGTVGWIDARSDAHFVVAIRCGLIGANVAHVYSGAGIVKGSDAAAEYAETELKQLPMLRALGVAD